MANKNTYILLVLGVLHCATLSCGNVNTFRAMTFNIWRNGNEVKHGQHKIVKHINLVKPDVVVLQEVDLIFTYKKIADLLGPKWYGDIRPAIINPDTAIFSRWPIVNGSHAETDSATSIEIEYESIDGPIRLTVWNVHFDYKTYGPDAACNKHVTEEYQIMAGETVRIKNAQDIAALPAFKKALTDSDKKPLILMGDFNTPSHLDWIENTKPSHCDWSFKWPTTLIFDNLGMKDSYREMNPDPKQDPAITFSDVYKYLHDWNYTIPYPADRIDFILYKSSNLKVVKSITYHGDKPVHPEPHHKYNDWPSDHNAVVTDFQLVNPA